MKRNFVLNILYQFLCICLPFVVTPYISRIFGAEGIGEFSYNYTVVSYFGIFVILGLNNYGNREIATKKDDKNTLSDTFINIFSMQFIIGLIVIIIYFLYYIFVAHNLITLLFFTYLLSYLFDINWFFFGMEEFKITVVRNTIIKIISTIAILLFIKKQSDIYTYIIITSISYFISQISVWPFLKDHIKYVKPKWAEIKKHIKPNLILFIPVLGVSLYNMMDKVMIGILSSKTEVGYYESADKLKAIPILFVTALGTVALPRISYLNEHKQESEINRIFKNSILVINFVMSSICFGIIAVCSDFVPLFFGKGFEKTIYVLYMLLPSCIFIGIENVIKTQYLIPKRLDIIYIKSIFLGAALNLLMNIIMIRYYGSIGASIATFLTELTVCGYQILKVYPGINVLRFVFDDIIMYISGFIMIIIVKIIPLGMTSEVSSLIVKIFIGALIYFFILMIFGKRYSRYLKKYIKQNK